VARSTKHARLLAAECIKRETASHLANLQRSCLNEAGVNSEPLLFVIGQDSDVIRDLRSQLLEELEDDERAVNRHLAAAAANFERLVLRIQQEVN